MRKSIFLGIKDAYAQHYLLHANLGDRVSIICAPHWGNCMVEGQVTRVECSPHGILLYLRNTNFGKTSALPGWKTIPLWLSQCGSSGVLCRWGGKNPDVEAEIARMEREEEAEALNCLAL